MRRVLPATPAEFLQLQAIRSGFPVLGSRIIPLFAITALQRNDLSGHSAPSFFLCGAGALAREKLSELRSAWTAEGGRPYMVFALLHNLADGSCAHRVPAFADREAQAFLHRHRRDQLNHQFYLRTTDVTGVAELPSGTEMVMPGDNVQLVIELITSCTLHRDGNARRQRTTGDQLNHQLYVVSGHYHLGARGKLCHSGDIRRAQIKLRAISLEERRVPSAFFFRQNVNLSFELGVWRDRTTFRQHHATLHFIFADTAQQKSSIVSRHAFIELLLEHLHAGDHRLSGLAEADDFNFFSHLHLAALDSARDHRAAPRDREDIFNRHQERLFNLTLRYRHILVHRLHQLVNLLLPLGFAIQRAQRGKPHHRNFVSRKLKIGRAHV